MAIDDVHAIFFFHIQKILMLFKFKKKKKNVPNSDISENLSNISNIMQLTIKTNQILCTVFALPLSCFDFLKNYFLSFPSIWNFISYNSGD